MCLLSIYMMGKCTFTILLTKSCLCFITQVTVSHPTMNIPVEAQQSESTMTTVTPPSDVGGIIDVGDASSVTAFLKEMQELMAKNVS